MATQLPNTALGLTADASTGAGKAWVWFDEDGLIRQAQALLDLAARRLGGEREWSIEARPLSGLESAGEEETLRPAASEALVVVVVSKSGRAPSPALVRWLVRWAESRPPGPGFVATYCRAGTGWPSALTTELRRFTRRYGLGFLCPEDLRARNGPGSLLEALERREQGMSPTLLTILDDARQREPFAYRGPP